jgi:tripartite-type tricarboxylate transporter receptor subunit TctC
MFAPKGTPPAIIETLNQAMRKAADVPAYKAALERDGLVPSVNSPSEMEAFMRAEVERWKKVVTTAKITQD